MKFGVLGPISVWTAEGVEVPIKERKLRVLLAALLVDPGRIVPAERLADQLWPEAPDPIPTLQAKVSTLRRLLDKAEPGTKDLISHIGGGYRLDTSRAYLDLHDFLDIAECARYRENPQDRAARFAQALRLFRGDPYADAMDTSFAKPAIARCRDHWLNAIIDHAAAQIDLGRAGVVASDLSLITEQFPLQQKLRAVHMTALYRSGQEAVALQSYEELRKQLAEELGIDPSPELAQLQLDMLRQAPHLTSAPVMAPVVPIAAQLASVGTDGASTRPLVDYLIGCPEWQPD